MRGVSVFSGAGGFELAFDEMVEVVALCEIDRYAQGVLRFQYPDIPLLDDVKKLTVKWLKEVTGYDTVEIVFGGFPCQDASVAGKREGMAGVRTSLVYEFLRFVGEVRPKWIILENVTGIISSWTPINDPNLTVHEGRNAVAVEEKNDLVEVLAKMEELGYQWEWRTLDAQNFGVPQRRRRVFIVGYCGDSERLDEAQSEQDVAGLRKLHTPVLFEQESM